MADKRLQASELMIGANDPLGRADTVNRALMVEHNSDGTHQDIHANSIRTTLGGDSMNYYGFSNSFVPQVRFAVAGDLSVSYSNQKGSYTRIGRLVFLTFSVTATMTFTTASGSLIIFDAPFTSVNLTGNTHLGSCSFTGINKTGGYTQFAPVISTNTKLISITASGNNLVSGTVTAADITSGFPTTIQGTLIYQTT